MKNSRVVGHILALFTVMVWGTTFISTKLLLVDFQPVEVLFIRFLFGLTALTLAAPKRLKGTTRKQELTFALAGLCGVCLYFLLENIALTYTLAANVSVIISVAPFFTAILARLLTKTQERLRLSFFCGFVAAMAGICLITFSSTRLKLNPIGDVMTVGAAIVWACYSILTKEISTFGYSTVLTTRRIFAYGTLFMLPTLFFFNFQPDITKLLTVKALLHFVYLGVGASALCFATWNYSVKLLGPVRTSVYIYASPIITIIASAIVLHEPITPLAWAGTALTLVGLLLSEFRSHKDLS